MKFYRLEFKEGTIYTYAMNGDKALKKAKKLGIKGECLECEIILYPYYE